MNDNKNKKKVKKNNIKTKYTQYELFEPINSQDSYKNYYLNLIQNYQYQQQQQINNENENLISSSSLSSSSSSSSSLLLNNNLPENELEENNENEKEKKIIDINDINPIPFLRLPNDFNNNRWIYPYPQDIWDYWINRNISPDDPLNYIELPSLDIYSISNGYPLTDPNDYESNPYLYPLKYQRLWNFIYNPEIFFNNNMAIGEPRRPFPLRTPELLISFTTRSNINSSSSSNNLFSLIPPFLPDTILPGSIYSNWQYSIDLDYKESELTLFQGNTVQQKVAFIRAHGDRTKFISPSSSLPSSTLIPMNEIELASIIIPDEEKFKFTPHDVTTTEIKQPLRPIFNNIPNEQKFHVPVPYAPFVIHNADPFTTNGWYYFYHQKVIRSPSFPFPTTKKELNQLIEARKLLNLGQATDPRSAVISVLSKKRRQSSISSSSISLLNFDLKVNTLTKLVEESLNSNAYELLFDENGQAIYEDKPYKIVTVQVKNLFLNQNQNQNQNENENQGENENLNEIPTSIIFEQLLSLSNNDKSPVSISTSTLYSNLIDGIKELTTFDLNKEWYLTVPPFLNERRPGDIDTFRNQSQIQWVIEPSFLHNDNTNQLSSSSSSMPSSTSILSSILNDLKEKSNVDDNRFNLADITMNTVYPDSNIVKVVVNKPGVYNIQARIRQNVYIQGTGIAISTNVIRFRIISNQLTIVDKASLKEDNNNHVYIFNPISEDSKWTIHQFTNKFLNNNAANFQIIREYLTAKWDKLMNGKFLFHIITHNFGTTIYIDKKDPIRPFTLLQRDDKREYYLIINQQPPQTLSIRFFGDSIAMELIIPRDLKSFQNEFSHVLWRHGYYDHTSRIMYDLSSMVVYIQIPQQLGVYFAQIFIYNNKYLSSSSSSSSSTSTLITTTTTKKTKQKKRILLYELKYIVEAPNQLSHENLFCSSELEFNQQYNLTRRQLEYKKHQTIVMSYVTNNRQYSFEELRQLQRQQLLENRFYDQLVRFYGIKYGLKIEPHLQYYPYIEKYAHYADKVAQLFPNQISVIDNVAPSFEGLVPSYLYPPYLYFNMTDSFSSPSFPTTTQDSQYYYQQGSPLYYIIFDPKNNCWINILNLLDSSKPIPFNIASLLSPYYQHQQEFYNESKLKALLLKVSTYFNLCEISKNVFFTNSALLQSLGDYFLRCNNNESISERRKKEYCSADKKTKQELLAIPPAALDISDYYSVIRIKLDNLRNALGSLEFNRHRLFKFLLKGRMTTMSNNIRDGFRRHDRQIYMDETLPIILQTLELHSNSITNLFSEVRLSILYDTELPLIIFSSSPLLPLNESENEKENGNNIIIDNNIYLVNIKNWGKITFEILKLRYTLVSLHRNFIFRDIIASTVSFIERMADTGVGIFFDKQHILFDYTIPFSYFNENYDEYVNFQKVIQSIDHPFLREEENTLKIITIDNEKTLFNVFIAIVGHYFEQFYRYRFNNEKRANIIQQIINNPNTFNNPSEFYTTIANIIDQGETLFNNRSISFLKYNSIPFFLLSSSLSSSSSSSSSSSTSNIITNLLYRSYKIGISSYIDLLSSSLQDIQPQKKFVIKKFDATPKQGWFYDTNTEANNNLLDMFELLRDAKGRKKSTIIYSRLKSYFLQEFDHILSIYEPQPFLASLILYSKTVYLTTYFKKSVEYLQHKTYSMIRAYEDWRQSPYFINQVQPKVDEYFNILIDRRTSFKSKRAVLLDLIDIRNHYLFSYRGKHATIWPFHNLSTLEDLVKKFNSFELFGIFTDILSSSSSLNENENIIIQNRILIRNLQDNLLFNNNNKLIETFLSIVIPELSLIVNPINDTDWENVKVYLFNGNGKLGRLLYHSIDYINNSSLTKIEEKQQHIHPLNNIICNNILLYYFTILK